MNKTFKKDSIIQVDDELIVVVDRSLNANPGDTIIFDNAERRVYTIHEDDTNPVFFEQPVIIAKIQPQWVSKRIEGVPLIVLHKTDEESRKQKMLQDLEHSKQTDRSYTTSEESAYQIGWNDGYWGKSAQGRWTDEDMRKAFLAGFSNPKPQDKHESYLIQDEFDKFLQSFQKKIPTSLTLEYEEYCSHGDECPSKGAFEKQHLCDIKERFLVTPDEHGGVIHPLNVSYE